MSGRAIEGHRWSWAAYLGASWTWCIGMFLPVLLIRDYGPWAWVIFAVPNAVGAAAMGWVMRRASTSEAYTRRHASACRLFSFVTIAFQAYFAMWMLPKLVGPVGYVGVVVLVQSAFTPLTDRRWLRIGGAAVLLLSVLAALGMATRGALAWSTARGVNPGDAAGLLLVCLAGFLTCPYLDLTFHCARQSTNDRDAKFAFGVGFGVLFLAMIVLTFFYAGHAARIGVPNAGGLNAAAAAWLAIHLLGQMTYTVHVHAAELTRQAAARDDAGVMRAGLGVWLAVAVAAAVVLAAAAQAGTTVNRYDPGEIGYRVFMACYGLLFPAYVLLAIGRSRVSTTAWLLTAAAASPFYVLAFLQGRMVWATAGVAVVLVGAALGRRFTPAAPAALPE